MTKSVGITNTLFIPESELDISFIRSSGPGGQNVNKVSTAAQLRFDLGNSGALPAGVKARAAQLAGSRLTNDGVIVITAGEFRTQQLNRDEAIARLVDLLRRAAIVPKRRVPTRPTLASKKRRLQDKTRTATTKRLRGSKPTLD